MKKQSLAWMIVMTTALGVSAAQADPRRAGLWEQTVNVTFSQGGPQISPEQLEKMKQMGIQLPFGRPIVSKVCVTPEMAARNDLPKTTREQDACKMTGYDPTANPITAEMTCQGEMKGKGNLKVFHDSSDTYRGTMDFSGTDHRGAPIAMQSTFSGKWLAADCGDVKPLSMPK